MTLCSLSFFTALIDADGKIFMSIIKVVIYTLAFLLSLLLFGRFFF
jgi:hypothetical protein